MDVYAAARLIVGAGVLLVAAASDVRTRRVPDPLWVALGSVGLGVLVVELLLDNAGLARVALVPATAILFYAVFYGKPILDEDGIRLRPARVALLVAALALIVGSADVAIPAGGAEATAYIALLTMPVMVLVYQGFYYVGLLRGGADAKGLIALTLLVPLYPAASPLPLLQPSAAVQAAMQVFFPFSLVVLADAAVLMLAVPLGYLVVNLSRGDFGKAMLWGTREPIDRLPPHTWLMERVDPHGERYVILFPSRTKDHSEEIAKLRAAGATRVWVERKVPLILLLFLGFFLAVFVGNLVLGFLTAVLPAP